MCMQGQIGKSAQPSLLKHSPDSGNYDVSKTQSAVFSIAGRSRKLCPFDLVEFWQPTGSFASPSESTVLYG